MSSVRTRLASVTLSQVIHIQHSEDAIRS